MTAPIYSLTSVRYLQNEREIVCVFSGENRQQSKRFAFFPVLITNASSEELFARLSPKIARRLRLADSKKDCCSLLGSDFALLEKMALFIESRLQKKTLLIPAERQFLLQQNWNLFDSFEFNDSQVVRLNETVLPPSNLGFLPASLEKTAKDFLKTGKMDVAAGLFELVWWSSFLKIPISELPQDSAEREKIILQNLFFLSGVVRSDAENFQDWPVQNKELPLRVFEKTTEFDFADTTALLCTKPYYNLGFESINCRCCRPLDASSPALLPNSMATVRILSNGFFFESFFRGFAFDFHHSKPDKQSRENRQNEFGYACPPVGPFEQGQLAKIPLADALELEKNEHGIITGLDFPIFWTCRLHESALSNLLSDFSVRIVALERSLLKNQKTAVQSNGLKGFVELELDSSVAFQKQGIAFWSRMFAELPNGFLDSKKQLFGSELFVALSHVRQLSLAKFALFNERLGNRTLQAPGQSRAFVAHCTGVSLANAFSKAENHPVPTVMDWHFWPVLP